MAQEGPSAGMSGSDTGGSTGPTPGRRDALVVLALCAILFVPGIGGRDLWAPDEVRYAEVAREMVILESFLIPQLNGADYTHKPPLFFWLAILFAQVVGGVGPVAVRAIAALSAAGTVLLTFWMGRRWAGARTGLWAGAILATSVEFWWMAGHGAMDTLLAFLVTAAMWAFTAGYHGTSGRNLYYLGFALFSGLAVLAKGPVGLIIPALAAAVYAVSRDGLRALRAPRAAWTGAAALLVVGLWLGPVYIWGESDYLREILYRQNIERIAEPWGHVRPWYYYLWNFPLDFLPWAIFFPGACVWFLRRRSRGRTGEQGGSGSEVMPRMAASWFFVTLLFFSLLSTKREKYLLPCYPAAALLLAYYLAAGVDQAGRRGLRWLSVPGGIFFSLLGLVGLVVAGAGLVSPERIALLFPREGEAVASVISISPLLGVPGLTILGAGIVGAAALALWAVARGNVGKLVSAVVVAVAVVGISARGVILPRINPIKSARSFSAVVAREAGESGRIGIYKSLYEGAYNYYTGRIHLDVIPDPEAAAAYLSSEVRSLLIVRDRHLEQVRSVLDTALVVAHKGRIGGKRMVALLSVGPGSGEEVGGPVEEGEK